MNKDTKPTVKLNHFIKGQASNNKLKTCQLRACSYSTASVAYFRMHGGQGNYSIW